MFFQRLLKICFVVWIVLWVVFFFRENKKGEYREFFDLTGMGLEEKRAYLMGEDFYNFVRFCQQNVPQNSRYKFAGLEPFAIEEVRAIYYLWPLRAVEEDYDCVFVYGDSKFSEKGFTKVAEFSKEAYILKKK
ncbi:MAG: hypothetical protein ACE5JK_04190 [Candidatus Omnitrophota bacterium]